ncbi:MAG: hypothetical protein WDA47_09465 [Bacilli bacterium]
MFNDDDNNDMEEIFEYENPARKGVGGDQLESVLAEVGVQVVGSSPIPVQDTTLTKTDGTVDEQKVYSELAALITSGKSIVNNLSYVDVNAEGALSGIASVLSSMRQMLGDFSKIHQDHLKFKRQVELETMKIEAKEKALERKHEMDLEKIRLKYGSTEEETEDGKRKLGYSQRDMIKAVVEAQKELTNNNVKLS